MNAIKEIPIEARRTIFFQLYHSLFPSVAAYIAKRGGNFEQAKDIFQDALIIYHEKTNLRSLVIERDEAYIFGICKHLWSKYSKDNRSFTGLTNLDMEEKDEKSQLSEKKLLGLLLASGKKCMDLLKSFYYDKLSMEQIAETFGFSGTRSATVQKFKCLEKIRNTVKEKSLSYESFLE
ncbi:RNA polymerase sigma factor [Olivibacter sitiensis]|uniref:RNA polymerase sigma factor n=1 Tax=Olivibacter sitiensis TaxID=376470 RepID=UPI00040CBAA6|nr:sigma-70 family RNA polymerase sigma factor [Olivibacter sitiensis]